MQTRFSRTVKKGYTPVTSCYYSHYETFEICDLTYTNDFPFSNGFSFTSHLCQPFKRLGHPFARNSPFEWLPHPLDRNINPFERLSCEFVRNIKLFKRLGHPFVEDRPFKRLGHLYYGIPLNFLSNEMHGTRVTLFIKKIHLFKRSFNSTFSRLV